jgi:tetratricopeptide (TPR) repeat protein
MVQPEWRELLERALAAGRGDHWLARLHLGNMRMEAGDPAGARVAWEESVARHRNSWALRNLAVLEARGGCHDRAAALLEEAWAAGPQPEGLAMETAFALHKAGRFSDARAFVNSLQGELAGDERLALVAAKSSLELGDYAAVERFFARRFSFVREGDRTLTDLWYAMHERRLAADGRLPLDEALRARVRRDFPPPAHIDFRMG